jgi:hypothetical protein
MNYPAAQATGYRTYFVMPVPDQVRDDGSGIQSFFFWIPAPVPDRDPGFAGMTKPRQAAGNAPEGIQTEENIS